GDQVLRAEGAVAISRYYTMKISGFNVLVVPICGKYVNKRRLGWAVQGPAFAKHDDLDGLGAGDIVERAEGAVGVTGNGPSAGEPVHGLVEVLAREDIGVVGAGQRCNRV